MEPNHCTAADREEVEARELDRLTLELDDVEPHLVEGRLDELAMRRQQRKLRDGAKILRATEATAKTRLAESLPAKVRIDLPSTANATHVLAQITPTPDSVQQKDNGTEFGGDSEPSTDQPIAPVRIAPSIVRTALPVELNISSASAPATSVSDADPVGAIDIYADEYSFPSEALDGNWPDMRAMAVAELAEVLRDLSCAMRGSQLVPYEEIRLQVCAISVELNRRGKLMPRFRVLRRPPPKIETTDDRDLSCDRQFIDLHWLHCTGWNRIIHGENWRFDNVLKVKKFREDKAEMFATVPKSFNEKASWLALPDNVAFQLAAIQTDAIRERFRVAEMGDTRDGETRQLGRMQVTRLLENSVANQPHLQREVPHWAGIWMCARLVGDHAEVLRQFHARAEGLEKPLDARDIARRLVTARTRIGEVRAIAKLAA